VLAGRAFTDDDGPDRPGVAVVNEAFVLEHGATVVGRRLRTAAPQMTWGAAAPAEFEILGRRRERAVSGSRAPERARRLSQHPAVRADRRHAPDPHPVRHARRHARGARQCASHRTRRNYRNSRDTCRHSRGSACGSPRHGRCHRGLFRRSAGARGARRVRGALHAGREPHA
jgi:hypothetical protein